MPIDVRLLGTLQIAGTSTPAADVYRTKRVAALVYLLLENRPVHRLELASLLWPESDEKRARGSLNELVLQLRRSFGTDAIIGRADDLLLDAGRFACDAVQLEAAARAGRHADVIRLFTGDLLPSFTLPDGSAFNDWLDRCRERIRLTVADSAWQLATAARDPREAVRLMELCAQMRPFDEAVLRRRLELVNATQGTNAALALYEQARLHFREQLGTSPGADTKALVNTLSAAPSETPPEPVVLNPIVGEPLRVATGRQWQKAVLSGAFVCILAIAGFKAFRPVLASGSTVDVGILPIAGNDAAWNAQVEAGMATLLKRERTVAIGKSSGARYRVQTTMRSDGDVISGTVEVITSQGEVKAAMPLAVSARYGPDTAAAVAARFVLRNTEPARSATEQQLALARDHVERAYGDVTRDAYGDVDAELHRADSILSRIPLRERGDEWSLLQARSLYLAGTSHNRQRHKSVAAGLFGRAVHVARSVNSAEARAIALRYRDYQSNADPANTALADSFRTELSDALARDPRNGTLWRQLSIARFDSYDFDGSLAAAEKARGLDPSIRNDLELTLTVFRAAFNTRNAVATLAECDRIRHLLREDWPADACSILSNGWAGGSYDLASVKRRLADVPVRAREGNVHDCLRLVLGAALARNGDQDLALKAIAVTPPFTTDAQLATCHLIALYGLGRQQEADEWRKHILTLPAGIGSIRVWSGALPASAIPR